MRIFDDDPVDWKDLQTRVGQMFSELGCHVAVGTRVELVRGSKEVDVLVADPGTTPPSEYLCECKYWSRPVPLEVVHSFRTVVSDRGAHRGFIIASAGFQAGAFEAARNTNLLLVTFVELQQIFFDRWRIAMGEKYRTYADFLFPYWDYGGKRPPPVWTQDHANRLHLLTEAYRPILHLGPGERSDDYRWRGWLPLTLPTVDEQINQTGTVTLATFRQLYDFIVSNKDVAVRRFQRLFGEVDA